MKIALAATKSILKSEVDAHFARSPWFCIYDTETQENEFIQNPLSDNLDKTGSTSAMFLADKGIKLAIAGRFGSKVVGIFREKDIQMIIPEKQKTIAEIIKLINQTN